MTTTVTVRASSHNVEVSRIDPATDEAVMPVELVPIGNQVVFYAHQGQDIRVSEVRDD